MICNEKFAYAQRATAFALQCSVILNSLHRQDRSTGFHALAARKVGERALAELEAVAVSTDPGEVTDHALACDDLAGSSMNILRAYLKQRGKSPDDNDDDDDSP